MPFPRQSPTRKHDAKTACKRCPQDEDPHTSVIIDELTTISTWRSQRRTILLHRSIPQTPTSRQTSDENIILRAPDDSRYHMWTQALFHAKALGSAPQVAEGLPATVTPLVGHPLIKRQLHLLCAQPDATQQLKEIGARSLIGAPAHQSRLIDELTSVFIRLVGPIPAWWSSQPVESVMEGGTDPDEIHLTDQSRLRSYVELWCRFILMLEPIDAREGEPRTEGGKVRAVDVVRAVLLALDLRDAVGHRFRRKERLERASLLVELVAAMLTWVSPATDRFKYSLLEYLGHPCTYGSPVTSEHLARFVRQLQRTADQHKLADFCELRLLLHPDLSSVQQLRALRQASLRDRNDLREVITAVQKVPAQFRNLSRIRISLEPFEERIEVIDGVPWAPLRLRHPQELVQLRLQLQLMRVLRELGVYDSHEVFPAVATEAVRDNATLVALFFRELCQEDVPLFLSGDRVRIEGSQLRHISEGSLVQLFDESGSPIIAPAPPPADNEVRLEPSLSLHSISFHPMSLAGSSSDSLHDRNEDELTLEGVDEAVGALVQLPNGLSFFNEASRHKSKPTKKAVERDAALIRVLLNRLVDVRASLEAKLRSRELAYSQGSPEEVASMLPGNGSAEGPDVGGVAESTRVPLSPTAVSAAANRAEQMYDGLDECLFRCLETVLLVNATSTSSKTSPLAISRDGLYRAFAARVSGDLVAAFSDPQRESALSHFIKHCELNLQGFGVADIDYSTQAQGARLGSAEMMVTGLFRLVIALGREQTFADLWALLQPKPDSLTGECDFVLHRNRSLRDKFCECLMDPGPHSPFVGIHSVFYDLLRTHDNSRDLLMCQSFWTYNGMRLWCKPTDRLSFASVVRAALADTDDPLPFELFIEQMHQIALSRRESPLQKVLSTNFKDPYPTSMVLRCCLFVVLERLDEEVDPLREPNNFGCLETLLIIMHAKSMLTDEVIAELANSGYVRVVVRFVTDFLAPKLSGIGESLESPRLSLINSALSSRSAYRDVPPTITLSAGATTSQPDQLRGSPSGDVQTLPISGRDAGVESLHDTQSPEPSAAGSVLIPSERTHTDGVAQASHANAGLSIQQYSNIKKLNLAGEVGNLERHVQRANQVATSIGALPMKDVERMVMCIANLATKLLDEQLLQAFNAIAPLLFDKFLAPHTPLYNKVCSLFFHPLLHGLIVDHDLIADEDFWQEDILYIFSRIPGSKVEVPRTGGASVGHEESEYYERLGRAVRQSASNMVMLEKLLKELRISTARLSTTSFPIAAVRAILNALLDYVGPLMTAQSDQSSSQILSRSPIPPSTYHCIEMILSIGQHRMLFDAESLRKEGSLLSLLVQSKWSSEVLSNYGYYFRSVLEFNAPFMDRKEAPPSSHSKSRTAEALQAIILALLGLAMLQPRFLEAFKQIVPTVFHLYLKTGTPMRSKAIHMLLKDGMYFRIHDKFKASIERDEDLMTEPFFWTEHVLNLFGPEAVERHYPKLNSEGTVYYDVVKLCLRLLEARGSSIAAQLSVSERSNSLRLKELRSSAREIQLAQQPSDTLMRPRGNTDTFIARNALMVRQSSEVLDTFENDEKIWTFFASIFPRLLKRANEDLSAFEGFELKDLAELAKSGRETLDKVGDLEKAQTAMTKLFETYLDKEAPARWKDLFSDAAKMAYNIKYMFREEVKIARERFKQNVELTTGEGRQMLDKLTDVAFAEYGKGGLIDQNILQNSNFLNEPQELIDVVKGSLKQSNPILRLIRQITVAWMEVKIESGFPLTPHHTQVLVMLIFVKFFEAKIAWPSNASKEIIPALNDGSPQFRALVSQMGTGEGKSIVIAMLAIFLVRFFNRKVHILENNEGLLQRDHETYKPLYDKFGISSNSAVDASSEVCYCLKKGNQAFFSRQIQEGTLSLSSTVLIVDEVDDLVVNEKPTEKYLKEDRLKTPDLEKALEAAHQEQDMPNGIDRKIWAQAKRWMKEAATMKLNIDYTMVEKDGKKVYIELIDGKAPKVPKTHGWLVYLMYRDFHTPPKKLSPILTMCTPYMYNKYECIFGLTGSVGGTAEQTYIEKTYNALSYNVPLFLTTCRGSGKTPARNKGVLLEPTFDAMIRKVCELTIEHYRRVPVLIITQGKLNDELVKVHQALAARLENDRMRAGLEFVPTSLMTLTERDENGRLLDWNWKTVIEDTTKRTGTGASAHFHITVTDVFGGRGHDFNCNDEFANSNGGMLVIATSIPDTREWIQWKGRTGRQDRPGQFYVVMSAQDQMFTKHKTLSKHLKTLSDDDKINHILKLQDEGINDTLLHFEREQAKGAWLNEICDKYFSSRQRNGQEWPSFDHEVDDITLSNLLSSDFATGEDIRTKAEKELRLQINGPPLQWGFPSSKEFGLQDGRQPLAITFLVDRTWEAFLQTVVNAVQMVFEEHLEDDDMVGYWGLGTGWIFEMARKVEKGAEMLEQIKSSAKHQNVESLLYADIQKVLTALAAIDDSYSKWFVLLSDLVDLQHKSQADSVKMVNSTLIPQIKKISGLNLVIIDASKIDRWKKEHHLWPTWLKNSRALTDAAQASSGSRGYNIPADNPEEIRKAFERVAALMQSGVADES